MNRRDLAADRPESADPDVIIIGSGAAGLFCALHLPAWCRVLLLTKQALEDSDSYLAQGGICMVQSEADHRSFTEDTLRAGHYRNDPAAVDVMIRSSRSVIGDLVRLGVRFEQEDGRFLCTREGGHSIPRILYHRDRTGKEIMDHLIRTVRERSNIQIHEQEAMVDLIEQDGTCAGVISRDHAGRIRRRRSAVTVLACGGVGGLFRYSTNFRHITGDGIAMAMAHGVETEGLDRIQLHPTAFYDPLANRCLLISESVRGEGAVLLNGSKERFTDELQPRDIVSQAVLAQMEKEGIPHVYLSMQHLGREVICSHFPTIHQECLRKGIDVLTDCIPVVPAQHYLMGGIRVDLEGKTSMADLYAIGETSCNGVHGANRLASNSLLECLVFARRAAADIAQGLRAGRSKERHRCSLSADPVSADERHDQGDQLMEKYHQLVLEKIREGIHDVPFFG